MKNIIVGTAGHIDHGKTALVKALTGVDADRLAEEKRRGITIDLGFAQMQLNSDIRVGIIDVPGHERFVRNMLAGAAGIDLVLFVISAEESIKPQTREHFDICRLLGVQAGIIVLTKADLVDQDILEIVSLEVDEFVAGSFLEGAPKVPVSSVTGAGIPELRAALLQAALTVREKSAAGWFRLPIDRAFVMKGFGTVVTGTLIAGGVRKEQEVELHPLKRILRVRNVQAFGKSQDRAEAGLRTALNIPDVAVSELHRGMVLSEANRLRPSMVLDCRLDLLSSATPLKNRAPVHFHIGSAELQAEVRFLDRRHSLAPGEWAWARIVLKEPVLTLPGDRFIVRMFSPVTTIGGGIVVDISGHRSRTAQERLERLRVLLQGTAQERIDQLVREQPWGVTQRDLIAWTGLRTIAKSPAMEGAGEWMIAQSRLRELRTQLVQFCREFHKREPLQPGVARQDLKGRVMPKASAEVFDLAVQGSSELTTDLEYVRLKSHKVVLRQDEQRARTAIEGAFATAGLATPSVDEVIQASGVEATRAKTLLQQLLREGRLIRVSPELVLHQTALYDLKQRLSTRKGERFSVPVFKDWTGVSRKYAIPLLEYLDREHLTRREGNERVLL